MSDAARAVSYNPIVAVSSTTINGSAVSNANSKRRREKMKRYVLAALLLASPVVGQELPPVPEGGLNHFHESPCTDNETKERGMCYLSNDRQGTIYLTFIQNERITFIRRLRPEGGYETMYVRNGYNTF